MPQPLICRSLRARAVMAPLRHPIMTPTVSIPQAPLVLLDLETEQGVTGRSYIFGYTPLALKPLVRMIEEIGPTLTGKAVAPLTRMEELDATFALLGRQGIVTMAMAGIDLAMWDALGRAQNAPVAQLLGAATTPLHCYDSLGLFQPGKGEAMIEASLARGFSAIKTKVAGGSVAGDLAALKALRGVTGPDVTLMIDYNQTLTAPEAIRRIRAFEDAGIDLAWVEEPVPAEDFAGHATVRANVSTAIQTGENWWRAEDAGRAMAAGICDHAMLDIVKIGGLTGWMRAAPLCAAASVPVSSHLFVEASAHALAATPGRHLLEYLDVAGLLLQDPPQVKDGHIVPQGPGFGMDWNEKAVQAALA